MAPKVGDKNVELMRGVLGSGPSEMDLVRALHLAKNDVTLAFNILFDTLGYKGAEINVKRTTAGSGARVSTTSAQEPLPCSQAPAPDVHACILDIPLDQNHEEQHGSARSCLSDLKEEGTCDLDLRLQVGCSGLDKAVDRAASSHVQDEVKLPCDMGLNLKLGSSKDTYQVASHVHVKVDDFDEEDYHYDFDLEHGHIKWLLVGDAEVLGYSTCRGSKLKAGDLVSFAFPKRVDYSRGTPSFWARGRGAAVAQQIVRFSTRASGEVCILMAYRYAICATQCIFMAMNLVKSLSTVLCIYLGFRDPKYDYMHTTPGHLIICFFW